LLIRCQPCSIWHPIARVPIAYNFTDSFPNVLKKPDPQKLRTIEVTNVTLILPCEGRSKICPNPRPCVAFRKTLSLTHEDIRTHLLPLKCKRMNTLGIIGIDFGLAVCRRKLFRPYPCNNRKSEYRYSIYERKTNSLISTTRVQHSYNTTEFIFTV
jgi:hypothetical protein